MIEPRTKMEFLYKEYHTDLENLVERLEGAKKEFPAAADAMAEKLNLFIGHVLAANAELAQKQITLGQEADRFISQSAAAAIEVAKLDIRQATVTAINETVGVEIAKAVGQINNAANNLVTQTSAAKHEILGAARSVSWGFGRILGMLIAASLISSLVVALGVPYLQGRGLAPAPDEETAKRVEAGRDFIQVLPQLDNATREKVIRLIQKNRAAEQK